MVVDLTISIVNANNRGLLKSCLASIYETAKVINFEIFVVDNCSTDGSVEMVRREFPEVHLLQNQVPLGYAANQNIVLRRAEGRYVGVFNDDLIFYPGALDSMVQFLDINPDVIAVGPQILTVDGRHVQYECARTFPTLWTEFCDRSGLAQTFPKSRLLGGVNMGYWDHNDTRDVNCLLGACMVVRTEAISQIGLLDEQFFMYGEDVDWPYRMKQAGWRIVFLSTAQVIHYKGQSTQQQPWKMGIELFHSQYKLFRKHKGRLYALAYRGIIGLISLGKLSFFVGQRLLGRVGFDAEAAAEKIKLHYYVLQWARTGINPLV